MKNKHKRKKYRKAGSKYKIYTLVFNIILFILMINIRLITIVKGVELKKVVSRSTTFDSLTLVYNDIDASNFPRIISLFTVTNEIGFVVGKLDENNFEVREDDVREFPIQVEELSEGEIGINVVLTIDRSGSMRGQPIEDAKIASSSFVELMQSKDQSAAVSFSNKPRTEYPFTGDKDSLIAAIAKIDADGSTAIFDALIHSVYLMGDDLKNRAIILLTDGADNKSQHTYQEALNAILSHEIRVFTIGLGLNQSSSEESILIDLAIKTGGLYYYSPTSSDLEEIYRAISKLLHHRYRISYTTHNPAKDGTLRHVRIDVFVNSNTSSDTASYLAPYEVDPVDPIDPVDPDEPEDPIFEVVPNPFTPNDDGFNDWTEFKKGDDIPQDWNISIMDRAGRLIRYLTNGENIWDGKDKSGKVMLPGIYLYIISNGNRIIHRGLIQLIR